MNILKLQSGVFPLSPSLFEFCNCSHSQNYQLYAGCTSTPSTRHSTDEHSMRLSVTTLMWILAFTVTDYDFWKYYKHKNFHRKMLSELVRNFCSGSDIAVNHADYIQL